jgi:hypothetical protein
LIPKCQSPAEASQHRPPMLGTMVAF